MRPAYLVQPDDVGVLQQLHDLHLPGHLLLVVRIKTRLVNDLDGHLKGVWERWLVCLDQWLHSTPEVSGQQ